MESLLTLQNWPLCVCRGISELVSTTVYVVIKFNFTSKLPKMSEGLMKHPVTFAYVKVANLSFP